MSASLALLRTFGQCKIEHQESRPRAYAREVGVNPPLSLIFYVNFITFARENDCFGILFACLFVDLMQKPRNNFACKLQGTW